MYGWGLERVAAILQWTAVKDVRSYAQTLRFNAHSREIILKNAKQQRVLVDMGITNAHRCCCNNACATLDDYDDDDVDDDVDDVSQADAGFCCYML